MDVENRRSGWSTPRGNRTIKASGNSRKRVHDIEGEICIRGIRERTYIVGMSVVSRVIILCGSKAITHTFLGQCFGVN